MKFLPQTSDSGEELFHMTAMVDVVFILLAFFIVAAQFSRPQRDVTLDDARLTPLAGAAAEDLPTAIPIRLFRGEAGQVRIVIGQTTLPPDAFDGITATLKRIDLPNIPVVVAPDLDLTVEQVALAMDAVLASPMKKLSLSRLAEEQTDTPNTVDNSE